MNKKWLLGSGIGLIWTMWLVGHDWGVSIGLITLFIIGAYGFWLKEAGRLETESYLFGCYLMLLSGVFAVTTDGAIRFIAGLLMVSVFFIGIYRLMRFEWFNDLGAYFKIGTKEKGFNGKAFGQIILGFIIALPMVMVALMLLSSADAIFEKFVSNSFNAINMDFIGLILWRFTVFLIVSVILYSTWVSLPRVNQKNQDDRVTDKEVKKYVTPLISGTVLIMLNSIYLVFVYIQIRFLFLAQSTTLLGDYHYANYAREGFFELMVLCLFNVSGMWAIHQLTHENKWIKVALLTTIGCTFVMILSSAYKMYLYESAYGFTRLRLYVYMILIYLAVFMLVLTLGVIKSKWQIMRYVILFGLVYFIFVAYINWDSVIVDRNIKHYYQTGQIDMLYLANLSEDAVPELLEFMKKEPNLVSDEVRSMILSVDNKDWFFEYNIRNARSKKAIDDYLIQF